MTVTINGTTGVTTPDVTSDSYTGPISVSASAPDNSVQLNSSGNLGLGVTPSAWGSGYKALQVSGASLMASSAYAQLGVNNYWNGTNDIYISSLPATYYVQTAGAHKWYTAPSGTAGNAISFTQAMTLDSSGNLLVGTTSAGGTDKVRFASAQASANGLGIVSTDDINGGGYISFRNSAAIEIGAIKRNGTSAVSYNTSSDYRLKENIQPMIGALAKVAALKPCTYNWKADGSDGEGFIAHELAEVVPQCVTGEKDAVDAEGKPVYQGIDTSFLVATLTAAIQEQQAIIDSLTTRIAALEAK